MSDKEEVKLIDLSAVFRMVWHGTENLPVSQAESLTLAQVRRIAADSKGPVAICCDGKGNWRKDLDATYKAHREKQPQEMYGALDRIKARLIADGHLLWTFDGFEADDVIYAASEAASELGHPVMVATHDKDLFQCLRFPSSRVLRINDGSVWTEKELLENVDSKGALRYGVTAKQFGDWLALVGDDVDGVPGCPGVGRVKATALIRKYGGLMEMFEDVEKVTAPALDEFWGKRKALHAALKENEAVVMSSRKFIGFRTPEAFDFSEIFKERKVKSYGNEDESEYLDDVFGDGSSVEPPTMAPQEAPKVLAKEEPPEMAADVTPSPHAEPETFAQPGAQVFNSIPLSSPAEPPKTPEVVTEKALAVRKETALAMSEFNSDLEPTGMRGLYWLCRRLQDGHAYEKFKSADQMLTVILRGRALGMPTVVALDAFHMVEGTPTLKCHVISALAEKEPTYEYLRCLSTTNEGSKWVGKKRGEPELEHEFTIEDAINHGYCVAEIKPRDWKEAKDRRGQWDKSRKEMLRKTAMVQLIRILWPGAAQGLYSYEELGGNE